MPLLPSKPSSFRERRSHARVDDNIVLMWRPVKPEEVPGEICRENNHMFFYPLASQLRMLRQDSTQLLAAIKENSPLLAEYLQNLERQFDVLASAIRVMDEVSGHTPQAVSLSASGIAFLTDKPLPVNTFLELKMILPPALHSIMAYGRVVDFTANDDVNSYTVGVGFVRLNEYERKYLIRHVARRQILLKLLQASSI